MRIQNLTTILVDCSCLKLRYQSLTALKYKHKGKDRLDNMICVCPSCHVQLDSNSISLEKKTLLDIRHDSRHDISDNYIAEHNSCLNA